MSEDIYFKKTELLLIKKYYEEEVLINPNSADAYFELGHYFEIYEDNLEQAEYNFRKAIECGGRENVYAALLRVLIGQKNINF